MCKKRCYNKHFVVKSLIYRIKFFIKKVIFFSYKYAKFAAEDVFFCRNKVKLKKNVYLCAQKIMIYYVWNSSLHRLSGSVSHSD
jgi:hypothetical protein